MSSHETGLPPRVVLLRVGRITYRRALWEAFRSLEVALKGDCGILVYFLSVYYLSIKQVVPVHVPSQRHMHTHQRPKASDPLDLGQESLTLSQSKPFPFVS